MANFYKDTKKMLKLLLGVLLALTAAIGLFAAVRTGALSRWVEGFSKKQESSSSVTAPSQGGSSSQPEGTVITPPGNGEETPIDRTEGGSPSEETPIYFNRPSEMRAVYLTAGVDFLSDGDLSADKVQGDIDKALQNAKDLSMNSVIVNLTTGGKAIYFGTTAPAVETDFDVLDYLLKKAKEMGFYTYVRYDVLTLPGESGFAPAQEVDNQTVNLLEDSIKRLVTGYQMDGLLLDDYYNPYGEDSYTQYLKHGGGIGYENYMRGLSEMVFSAASRTVRENAPQVQVGMLAEAVWENRPAQPDGSQTSASFTALGTGNADNLSYAQKGLVDFVAVKAFGATTDPAAPFGTVVSSWAEQLSDYDLPFYVVHAADKAVTDNPGWGQYDQMVKQLVAADNVVGFDGSIYNSLGRMLEDPEGSFTKVKEYYSKEINLKHVLTELAVTKPAQTTYSTFEKTVTFMGASDPNVEVTINGERISTDQNGYFTVQRDLAPGENKFVIVHKGRTITYNITRKVVIIKEVKPEGTLTVDGNMKITISAIAYEDANVYAVVGGQTIGMSKVQTEDDSTEKDTSYARFEGTYTAPAATNAVQTIGNIVVYGEWQGVPTQSKQGAMVKVNKKTVIADGKPVRVTATQAETFPTSVIDDYSDPSYFPLPQGTIDYTVGDELIYKDGDRTFSYYKLASGVRVYTKDITAISESEGVGNNSINGITVTADGNYTKVILATQQKVSYRATYTGSSFNIAFNYTTSVPGSMNLNKNPLFSAANWSGATLQLPLKQNGRFIGYKAYYDDDGNLVFRFNNPPGGLSGARIVVDPGHDTSDPGTLGFLPAYPERVINAAIGELVADELRSRGASVYLIQSASQKVTLANRVEQGRSYNAHVLVSIHGNSAPSDAKGSEAYYFNPYSKNLASQAANAVSSALGTTNRGGKFGYYYVTRDPQFASTLIETGFLSNEREYRKLIDEEYQAQIASGIADAVDSYLRSMGSGSGTGTQTNGDVSSVGNSGSSSDGGGEVTGVSLNKNSLTLQKGKTAQLSAEVMPSDADNTDVLWESDDEEVATVSQSGKITAVGEGKALITVITEDGEFTDECLVTVTASGSSGSGGGVEEVSLNKERLDLAIGDSYTLKATIGPSSASGKGVTWDTTNSSVATVSSSGVVKAKKEGTCEIVATAADGDVEAYCVVYVTEDGDSGDAPEEIELDTYELELPVGESDRITASILPKGASAGKIRWEVETLKGKNVARTVDRGDAIAVTGRSPGEILLTAYWENDPDIYAECYLIVVD